MAGRELHVWANGQLVGAWAWSRSGTHSFSYADSWLRSPQVRPLSLSLPIAAGDKRISGPAVEYFFDNLLPDNELIRERIRARYRLTSVRPQELLAAIGRDCVGAVQLLPPGATPEGYDRIEATALTDAEIERTLVAVTGGAVLGQRDDDDHFRISIAGAQEKTALLKLDGQWLRPHGATPTTHILKLPLGLVGNMRANMSTSVENEWLCSRIMTTLGFDVAVAFWLLAATDGHAKNFSLALLPGGGHRLTPLYDIVSAWPIIGSGPNHLPRQRAKLAMALHSKNVHYLMDQMQNRHWQGLALQSGVAGAWETMLSLVERVDTALDQVRRELPADFPPQVWTSIRDGMLAQRKRFQSAA